MSNPALYGEKCDVCMALITKIIRRLLPFLRHNGYRISFAKFFLWFRMHPVFPYLQGIGWDIKIFPILRYHN